MKWWIILLCLVSVMTVGCQKKEEVVNPIDVSGKEKLDTIVSSEKNFVESGECTIANEKESNENLNDSKSSNLEENANDEYFFKDSASVKIEDEELRKLSLDELEKAKNEIFARHGHDFLSKSLKEYFESQKWYKAIPGKKVAVSE